ncbi:unnamed protein product, partial [Staurois parvus]
AGILTLGGTDLVSLTSPLTPIQCSVLIKRTDTVLMALDRKGLTCGAIKGLTVCCFTVSVFCCKHTALYGSAMQSHTKQCAGADGRDLYCLHTGLFAVGDTWLSLGAGE